MSFTILDNRDKNELLELINSGGAGGVNGKGIVSIEKTSTSTSEAGNIQDVYTITYTDNTTSEFTVTNGKDGVNGTDGLSIWKANVESLNNINLAYALLNIPEGRKVQVGDLVLYSDGIVCSVTKVTENYVSVAGNDQISLKGSDGLGIVSVEKTGIGIDEDNRYTDTYTITYTDGTTSEFVIINGKDGTSGNGIVNIEKTLTTTSESGATTDTYTIHYTTGETFDFTVTNGKDGKSAYTYAQEGGYNDTEEEFAKKLATSSLTYEETRKIYLGESVLGAPTLGEGWTSEGDTYTHAANTTADLTFATTVENGEVYLLTFTTNYASQEFVRVGLGEQYRVRCYQGKTTIVVPLYADGDNATLYFTPDEDGKIGFQIQDIKLRKIQETGTEYDLDVYGSATDNHTSNYGFWNTLIGHNTANNAVGATRTIAIGKDTLRDLQGGHRNIGIGTFVMSQMKGGESNVSIGADSMLAVKGADRCIAMGMGAMYEGASRKGDIALGENALKGTPNSNTDKNIGIGARTGYRITSGKSNVFIGNNTGYNNTSGYCNTYIGEGAAKDAQTAYFNTAIGRNTVIPPDANNCIVIGDGATATKSKQAVIGSDNITETLLKGNLVVRGTDGVYRQIVVNDQIEEIEEKITEKHTAFVSSGSFISKGDGKLYAGANYGTTAFIPVNGGESIKLRGFNCPADTNASVYAYAADFTAIGAIITDEVDSGEGKIITLGDNVAYIRVTSSNTGSVIVEYLDKPIALRTDENAPYNLGTLTSNCFISKENGEVLSNTSYYGVTEYIEVTARHLKIENPELSGNASICEYDENYNFISCVLSPEVRGGQYVVQLSSNAKYIRATVVNNNTRWLRLYPVSKAIDNSETSDITDSWLVATGKQIKTPFAKINALSPTITIIDDDTMRYEAVKRYHDILANKGVKGCYGVITDYLDKDENLKNLLLEYEEEGFGMLFHAKWQDTYYMEGENRDIVQAEKDYCQGIRKMREIGFIDYDYWVSPYGVTDTEIKNMCKRHGAKCLLSTANKTFIQNNGLNGNSEIVERYALPRCSLGYNDSQYEKFKLADLKAQIDKCVQANGWLIITTHVQQWADEYGTTPDERLSEVIQYALDNGCEIKTFSEAYAERNSILMLNDIC